MGTPEPFRDPDVRDEIADDLAELTVANGMNTMKHSRDVDDMIPYERPVTEPAPTVDPKAGGAWSVGEPGHRQPPESWKRRKLVERQAHGAERDEDEPAMTITSSADNGNFLIEEHDVPRGVHRPTTGMPSGRLERDGDRPGPSVSTDAHTWRLTQEGDPSPEAGKLPTYRPPEDDADRLFDVGPAEVGSGREHSTRYHDSAHDHLEGTVSLQRRSAGAPPVDTEREPSPGIAGAAMAKGVWQVEDRRDLTPEQESLASEPAPTIVGGRRSADGAVVGRQLPPGQDESVGGWSDRRDGLAGTRVESDQADRKDWADDRPATTVAARELVADPGHNANRDGGTKSRNDGIRVELEDVLVLQSFPEDYPVQGSRTERFRQAGNAVPPRLAAHVLASVAGLDPPEFGDPWPRRGSTGGS